MVETLRSIHIFAGLSEECLEYLSSVMQSMSFKAGEEIIKEGETGKSMYMIESGSVEEVKGSGDKICYSIIILNIARDISRRLRKLDAKYAAISC